MPTWLIFAAFATIGVTALLTAVLYRINARALPRRDRGSGEVAVASEAGGGRAKHDAYGDGGGGGGDGGGD